MWVGAPPAVPGFADSLPSRRVLHMVWRIVRSIHAQATLLAERPRLFEGASEKLG